MADTDLHKKSSSLTFSIVTITYNAEKVLERTLRSVQSQTYPFVQHLLIDGKSSDGTIGIVKKYQRANLFFLSEEDRGLYDAMNKGIMLAEGDYILFLNAGDAFHSPTLLEDVAQSIPQNTQPDVLYGETDIVDDAGRFIRNRRLSAPEVLTWESFQRGMLVCHQ
ncbi:MAG TPA: glycosyl transferase, partial [Porphyromonadaceae bacterium]|nr:glycosyl transferase [Porphyromonadaceae bacterium]